MIAATFLCHLPDSQCVGLGSLFAKALEFVAVGAIGGIAGSWLYWKSPASPLRAGSPLSFWLFAWACTAGWIWVPAIMLFAARISLATAFVAMIAAFTLATALRTETWCVLSQAQPENSLRWDEGELFAQSQYRPPAEPYGYLVALGLFAAAGALATHSVYTATLMLVVSASVFAWKNTVPRGQQAESHRYFKRAIWRVAIAVVPAVLLTMWALMDGIANRTSAIQASTSDTEPHAERKTASDPRTPITASGVGGYERSSLAAS